jgi:CheY-like chemotaxis protein
VSDPYLEQLREEFRVATKERVATARSLLSAPDVERIRGLGRHFHAFAGQGATYGYSAVTQLGDEGESSVAEVLQSGQMPSASVLARWAQILDGIERALDASATSLHRPSVTSRSRGKILAVDDDALHAAFLEHVLSDAGYAIRVCSSGAAARSEVAAFQPDLLLVDVQLGHNERGGYELVDELRARGTRFPVIFVSATRMGESPRPEPFVMKPVEWPVLLAAIRSVLQEPPQCGPPDAFSKSS